MGFVSNSCSMDKDSLPIHHQSSDDVGGGDCNSPNGAKLDPQSPPSQPVPPIPDPTNPELLVLAPSISPVEFGLDADLRAELMLVGNLRQFVDAAVFHLFSLQWLMSLRWQIPSVEVFLDRLWLANVIMDVAVE
ncbi:hypothetical protein Nepgr_023097 [Nepenthes gracilis]|uniref:Uncharacterized protein n=1 Tax=Nepenthes gracilis TaxID=150966 RepID=A0AAD3XYS6_NEPGR|nr:hypothetical protein Nepgr_023097 [Nepenthes gracilis]